MGAIGTIVHDLTHACKVIVNVLSRGRLCKAVGTRTTRRRHM